MPEFCQTTSSAPTFIQFYYPLCCITAVIIQHLLLVIAVAVSYNTIKTFVPRIVVDC